MDAPEQDNQAESSAKGNLAEEFSVDELCVVVIGASAGGLEACRDLLVDLPTGNLCYIFCQHLSPTHDSLLKTILSRETQLDVMEVEQNTPLQAGKFYVPKPNFDIEVHNKHIRLVPPKMRADRTPSPNVDKLLRSVADHFGANGIAIILSGSGRDGAYGTIELKNKGGLIFAQSPQSSRYDGMPRATISTHRTDLVADPKDLAAALARVVNDQAYTVSSVELDVYDKILQYVALHTKIDFSGYRKKSLQRRLKRRMNTISISDMEEYLTYLHKVPNEAMQFVQSSFVVVSEFYRDIGAFDALQTILLEQFGNDVDREIFRIWVAGCASGEEVYTIAMIFEELSERTGRYLPYKILATDLSHDALSTARLGVYEKEKLVNVPRPWLEKYFQESDAVYQVKQTIREQILFSYHDVLSDPPFSNIDLVSCRNLLIYFDQEVQTNILTTFLYSCRPGGLLFLGAAENCNEKNMFSAINEKQRIYQRNKKAKNTLKLNYLNTQPSTPATIKKRVKIDEQQANLYLALVNEFTPTLIIVNEDNTIIYKKGNYNALLKETSGFVDNNFFNQIQQEHRAKMRALLFKSRQNQSSTQTEIISRDEKKYRLYIKPVSEDFDNWYVIYLSDPLLQNVKTKTNKTPNEKNQESHEKRLLSELDQEISETRESLQIIIEEMESTNEQLQIYNEELQSTNEEYQSTNEELQTVNEELQSTNEELLTINEEYSTQSQLFQNLTNDLNNIQESIEIPLILINLEYRIKRVTSSCRKIFDTKNIKENDLIFALEWFCETQFIKPLLDKVELSQSATTGEVEINGRHYHCQVSQYLNNKDLVDGYTLIFYDTTEFKSAQEELENSKAIAQKTVETIMEGVIRIDEGLSIEYANPMSSKITGWSNEQMLGQPISRVLRIFNDEKEFNIDKVIQESIDRKSTFSTTEEPLILKTRRGKDVYIDISFSPAAEKRHKKINVIAIRDVSQRYEQFKKLIWTSTHDSLTGLINRKEMEKRIDRSIFTAKRNNINSTFMFLDLDQFKVINDTCGHQAGDLMLQQLSHMMLQMLRSRDTLARLGGDEFGLLLEKCPLIEAESIAIKLQKAINSYRFIYEEKTFRVGASIGIAEITPDVNQVSELLKDADTACFLAKEAGRNCIEVHTIANDALKEKRHQMRSLSDINDAIENNGFRLYFQEIKSLREERGSHWEVLIRMFKKEGEFLLPNAFLPAAERFGLIKQIDMWVLRTLFEKLVPLCKHKNIADMPTLNINVSGATIGDEEFLTLLKNTLDQSQYDPGKICIELTETAAISQYVKAKSFIEMIRKIGCKFALDDFGRGMSSLSYLRDLPLDLVKIDSSFIKNIDKDNVDNVIVKSVIDVSNLLNIDVVAEGVENSRQLESLKELRVNQVQGFLIARPQPFEEFASQAITPKPSA